MPDIELRNLTVRYGATAAVSDVSLRVLDREYCVLLGPSGCGKTSILRAIAGFVAPGAGAITIGGRDVTRLYPGDRNLAMIFQDYALYPHMTVRANFSFPLEAMKMSRAERQQRIGEIARLLRMEDLLDRYPRELSGGQQQRVAVGRALVRRCPVLLLDEPLGNLDAKLRVEMRASLKRIQRDLAITAVHVTHDQVEALALADRIVVMEEGRVRQIGSPEDVYERPENLFVAQFVGTPAMNILPCRLRRDDDRWTLAGEGFTAHVAHAAQPALADYVGRELVLGIRAEHIRLQAEAGAGFFPAQVYVTEPQGSDVIVDLQVGAEIVRARGDKEQWAPALAREAEVHVSFPFGRAHLFDPATSLRIPV